MLIVGFLISCGVMRGSLKNYFLFRFVELSKIKVFDLGIIPLLDKWSFCGQFLGPQYNEHDVSVSVSRFHKGRKMLIFLSFSFMFSCRVAF